MTQGAVTTGKVKAGLNRSLMIRVVVIAVVILGGVGVMNALERSLHLTFDKPPMPLTKPLAQLKTQFGENNRYVALNADDRLPSDEVDTLGTNNYLLRRYTDITKRGDDAGASLILNLNYYETGTSAFHVPEICWSGAGHVESTNSREFFTVKDVRHKDGTVSDITMRMVSFEPTQNEQMANIAVANDPENHLNNVAYLFEVNGKYIASPDEASSSFWKASYKYAYGTKIEVTVPGLTSPKKAQEVIGDYMRAALPEIEECMPDSSKLEETPAKGGTGTSTTDHHLNP